MAFELWSLRPDYSAIPLFYNFTLSHVGVFRITIYILIYALQFRKEKLETNGNRTLVLSKRNTRLYQLRLW